MLSILVATFRTTVDAQQTLGPCFLYDNYCFDVEAVDGTDPTTQPWLHYKGCLLHTPCVKSGFSLNCRDPNASDERYSRLYKFDPAGNTEAESWIKSLPEGATNVCVTAQGIVGREIGGIKSLSGVKQIQSATGCRRSGTGSTPPGGVSTPGGTPTTSSGNSGRIASTLQVGEPLEFVHTVKSNVMQMHYKNNEAAQTVFLCFENLMGDGYVAAGPGQGMAKGTRAVVAATGHDQSNVLDITEVGFPRQVFADFGHTKLQNLMQNGKRINCFQMPHSRLDDASGNANFAWAVGSGANFARHADRGVFEFNFQNGASDVMGAKIPGLILGHVICMITAFLILYPIGVLIAVSSGPGFRRGASYFKAHVAVMALAILVTIAGLSFAFRHSAVDTLHGYGGIVVSVLCVLQPVNAHFRPGKAHKNRRTWEVVHKGIGRLCVCLGFATCVYGAMLFDDRYGQFLLVVVFVPVVVVLMWLYFRVVQKKNPKPAIKKEKAKKKAIE